MDQEIKLKCYAFVGKAISTIKGFVWAESEDEAIRLALTGGYEEIDQTTINKVVEIDEVKEF